MLVSSFVITLKLYRLSLETITVPKPVNGSLVTE